MVVMREEVSRVCRRLGGSISGYDDTMRIPLTKTSFDQGWVYGEVQLSTCVAFAHDKDVKLSVMCKVTRDHIQYPARVLEGCR